MAACFPETPSAQEHRFLCCFITVSYVMDPESRSERIPRSGSTELAEVLLRG
jgi:hypothetical protein